MLSRLVTGGWVACCALALATGGAFAQEKKVDEKPAAKPPAVKDAPKADKGKEDDHGKMGGEDQEKMMAAYKDAAKLAKEHEILKQLAGKWKTEFKNFEGPEPTISSGTCECKLILDGRWLVSDEQGTMMNEPFSGHGMLGYDTNKKKFISVWTDSMGTGVMMSEGTIDAAGKVITFNGSWDDPVMKMTHNVRMVSTMDSPTKHTFEMFEKTPDSKEMKMMQVTYTR